MRPPEEQFCSVGEIDVCYETFGREEDPAILLIMGLGTQMLGWHEDFCEQLAQTGHYVIRFDNRDSGRSTHIGAQRPPSPLQLALRRTGGGYTLDDMAEDAAGLLTALGIDSADVVGASMGGMIAQTLAVREPERVRSLVSLMAGTGSWRSGQPALSILPIFLRRPTKDRERYIARVVETFRAIGSPGFWRDELELRQLIGMSYDRDPSSSGTGRQLAAIIASGNREPRLGTISVPTTIIHGSADRLSPPSGGRATAAAIPGARLVIVDGMGHDLPREVWPRLITEILENAPRAAAPVRVP